MSIAINVGDTRVITLRLLSGETQLALADITTLQFTLRDVKTLAVINDREDQNVKNANNVVVAVDGTITWTQVAADNPIVDSRLRTETHRLLVRCTHAGGIGSGEVDLVITNTERLL